jgi:hypothetical protein
MSVSGTAALAMPGTSASGDRSRQRAEQTRSGLCKAVNRGIVTHRCVSYAQTLSSAVKSLTVQALTANNPAET